ncbi:unnamed protein product [Chondrus crispus]|uniref:Uncharacterized protein n=1 Tax=Chondrus crispus TaxID=2769 RepID=R7QCY8_CHOCR|nr:unnamed protein product [Chondrus crispus]CDF35929.1 unnamed protein product [Chondrus crispus]|eukprot:XP_005715748.1 unnamed protein product [Chondrus crispus]
MCTAVIALKISCLGEDRNYVATKLNATSFLPSRPAEFKKWTSTSTSKTVITG